MAVWAHDWPAKLVEGVMDDHGDHDDPYIHAHECRWCYEWLIDVQADRAYDERREGQWDDQPTDIK